MEKSVDAFRTISEVSGDLDVPKHVLRFWEGKFAQLRPMKRGGGRRYYRPEDVELLKGIRRLLYDEGYTIKGVQKVLREQGLEFVKDFGDGEVGGAASGEVPMNGAAQVNGAMVTGSGMNGSARRAEASRQPAQSRGRIGRREQLELAKALKALEAARALLRSPAR